MDKNFKQILKQYIERASRMEVTGLLIPSTLLDRLEKSLVELPSGLLVQAKQPSFDWLDQPMLMNAYQNTYLQAEAAVDYARPLESLYDIPASINEMRRLRRGIPQKIQERKDLMDIYLTERNWRDDLQVRAFEEVARAMFEEEMRFQERIIRGKSL